jgi:DNA adenine methylase
LSHFPPHRVYVEPFGGGASVLLNKAPSPVEIYNDRDRRLVDLFSVLRSAPAAASLQHLLRLTPYHEAEYGDAWKQPLSPSQVERARLAFVQLRMSFGGCGARGRNSGFAFARTNFAATVANVVESLAAYTFRLRRVMVMSRDAADVIRRFDCADALIYCDPPYVLSTRKTGPKGDYQHEMSDADHERLALTLRGCQGKVIVSGYPSPLYARLYRGWRTADREQCLSISRGKSGQKRTERVWMNF